MLCVSLTLLGSDYCTIAPLLPQILGSAKYMNRATTWKEREPPPLSLSIRATSASSHSKDDGRTSDLLHTPA